MHQTSGVHYSTTSTQNFHPTTSQHVSPAKKNISDLARSLRSYIDKKSNLPDKGLANQLKIGLAKVALFAVKALRATVRLVLPELLRAMVTIAAVIAAALLIENILVFIVVCSAISALSFLTHYLLAMADFSQDPIRRPLTIGRNSV